MGSIEALLAKVIPTRTAAHLSGCVSVLVCAAATLRSMVETERMKVFMDL